MLLVKKVGICGVFVEMVIHPSFISMLIIGKILILYGILMMIVVIWLKVLILLMGMGLVISRHSFKKTSTFFSLKIAQNFPTSVSEEENDDLMASLTIIELQVVLAICKNDKSLDPDVITVEVYKALFDVLGMDLLWVVDGSRSSGKIPVIFNSTLIALILKSDFPKCFEDFRHISLCNCIYKIIGKVISTRIKNVLCYYIYGEKFQILVGRQIHDVVGVI